MKNFYSYTHQGLIRKENQDRWCVMERADAVIYMVADGMGGHFGGEIASQMACSEIKQFIDKETKLTVHAVIHAVEEANDAIWRKGMLDKSLKGMGTTVILLYEGSDGRYFINVGDSRLYGWNGTKLVQLSSDDSYVNMLVKAGEITEEQARSHPKRALITKALGTDKQLLVEPHRIEEFFEAYLLCSDGLSSLVEDKKMEDVFKCEQDEGIAVTLGSLALELGGTDNITLIVVQGNKAGVKK